MHVCPHRSTPSVSSLACMPSIELHRNHRIGMAAPNSIATAMAPTSRRRWRSSLASGLRAAMACTVVGLVSVYAPEPLRRHITFPAFSYVVTVIIVTDATVGTALAAAASAAHATVMGAVPSVVALWLAHRTGAEESVLATAAVVALTTFVVALPESPGPVAKRIALGQIIIIYVAKFKRGEHPGREFVLVHPANVVLCTALGVAAAMLAVLLPSPRLATREVVEKSRAYVENAAERVRVLVDAFLLVVNNEDDTACGEENGDGGNNRSSAACGRRRRWCVAACMSQAHRLSSASASLLHRISSVKGDLQWERMAMKWWATPPLADQLQRCIEMPIKGMEIAITASSELQQAHRTLGKCSSSLEQMRDQIRLGLLTRNHKSSSIKPSEALKTSRSPLLTTSAALPQRHDELASFLFLFSMDLLHRGTTGTLSKPKAASEPETTGQDKINSKVTPEEARESTDDDDEEVEELQTAAGARGDQEEGLAPAAKTSLPASSKNKKTKRSNLLKWDRLITAAKCAVSLGLAVLLGLLFNNDHGFWSGLIVATTMAAGRESTWALGLARAHGTAVGSVYGVLACLISQDRLMELRFLALLPWIVLAAFLKRSRAYGPAGGVAAALSGIIIVGRRYDEQPTAFTVTRLVETFIGLSCTVAADLAFRPKARPSAMARAQLARCIGALRECFLLPCADDGCASGKQKKVQEQVALLKKKAAEASSEPSFLWLPPFPASCYDKVHGSLSRMAQLLGLYMHARAHVSSRLLGDDLKRFHGLLSVSLGEIIKPSATFQEELDLEAGKGICRCCDQPEDMSVVQSFLRHARDALQREEEAEQQFAVCLGSIGFCMGEMIKEAKQLEAHMLDLRLQDY